MVESPQNHAHNEEEDRILPGKYVDIPTSNDIKTDNLCIGKVLSGKPVKITVVHNVLQHAWGSG